MLKIFFYGVCGFLAFSETTGAQTISTVAGVGSLGFSGDGGLATSAQLYYPVEVAVDESDNIYVLDLYNLRIRKIEASTGIISTIAGNGNASYNGDSILATSAAIGSPSGIALDGLGNIYISSSTHSIVRKVNLSTGIITTIAGNLTLGYSGDGGLATSAQLNRPYSIALDGSGNIYIADNYNFVIRKVDISTGLISTVAGNGTQGFSGDGGLATSAQLNSTGNITFDSSGNLYIADNNNHRIRKVDISTNIISTIAGNGIGGFSGDGGLATAARLNYPAGLKIDGLGNLIIGDYHNHRIRLVEASTGNICTIAGTGTRGYNGDGGPPTAAQLYYPYGVALDVVGNLFIADRNNNRIRKMTPITSCSIQPCITSSSSVNVFICDDDSFFVAGAYQHTSGLYNDTLSSTSGCDSVINTQLTVNPAFINNVSASICSNDSFFAAGAFQSASGLYYDTLSSFSGCDSVIILQLTVETPLSLSFSLTDATPGLYDGAVKVNVSGGTSPYVYSLDSITFQSSSTFTGLDTGTYQVYVTDNYGCTSQGTFVISGDTTVGLKDVNRLIGIKVFPNPFSDELIIELNKKNSISIKLIDVFGRVILASQHENTSTIKLNVTQIPQGVYYLEVLTNKGEKLHTTGVQIKAG